MLVTLVMQAPVLNPHCHNIPNCMKEVTWLSYGICTNGHRSAALGWLPFILPPVFVHAAVISLVYTSVADSRPARRQTPTVVRVFILQLATVASAGGRLSSAVADCSFQSSTMLNFLCSRQQSLALSIQSADHNSIYKVTTHADLKNTSCY